MRTAHRMACEALQLKDQVDAVADLIAKKILELAEAGETDPLRCCAAQIVALAPRLFGDSPDGLRPAICRRMAAVRVRADGYVAPCIPTLAAKPPSEPDWVHEIKHDGYRLIVRRDGPVVRLFTRRGYDWTVRFPGVARAASKLYARSFTLDGEAVVCGPDGVANFDALHRRSGSPSRRSAT